MRIVPFSTNSWIIGSVIVGIIWIIIFTFIFIKGINQIKFQEKKDKKRKSKEEYYDEKRWDFGIYTIVIGVGIPLIVFMWYTF